MRVVVLFLALAGCAAPAKPEPPTPAAPMTPAERCQAGGRLLGNPYMDPFQKQAILEMMRNRGCLQ
jgi:hypothetical protein